MGNEMGNNNTSAIKEEDNLGEAEKNGFQDDTNETSIAKDVVEKASIVINEPGKDTWQDEGHAEDVKGKAQTITTDEAKDEDSQDKTIGFASNHTTTVLGNDSMKGDTHASDVNMENQTPPTAEAEVVREKGAAALVSEDATTELGKVTLQEDSHDDLMKGNMKMLTSDEDKDVQEEEAEAFQDEVTGLNSNNTESRLKSDLLEEDTWKSGLNMENKIHHPTAEVEDVREKATGMTSHYSRSSLENDLLEGDDPEDDVNANHQKHKTVEENFDQLHLETSLDFDDETSEFDDKTHEDKQEANAENLTANGKDVQEKTIIPASDAALKLTNSFEGSGDEITEVRQPEKSPSDGSVEAKGGKSESLSSFSLKGTEEYEIETCNHHLNNKPSIQQGDEITEVRQPEMSLIDRSVVNEGGNLEILLSSSLEDTQEYVKQEETRVREHILVTDNHDLNSDPSIQQGDEISDVRQPEKSPNDEAVEAKDGNSESFSSFENTEEYEKQEETCLREQLLEAYSHHLNNESSIEQGDEVTEVSQPDTSNDGSVEAEAGNSEILSSSSLESTEQYEKQEESCLREEILLTHNHQLNNEPPIQQADVEESAVLTLSDVNMLNNIEIQESSGHSDNDEPDKFLSEQSFLGTDSLLEDNLLDTNSHSEQIKDDGLAKEMKSHVELCTDMLDTTSDSLNIDTTTNGNSLTKVNCTTEDSHTSPLESSVAVSPIEFDHEENCKVPYGKSILSRSGSMENSHDCNLDQCIKYSLKEYNMVYICDVSIESNGDCNGERSMLLDSNVFGLVTNDQVEESKVIENGVPFDAYVNNSNKALEESGATSEEKHSAVPEAKRVSLIECLTDVNCRHEEGKENKIEETNEKPEVSHVMINTFEGTEMSEQCNCDLVTINQEESIPLQNNSSLLHFYDDHQDNVKQDRSFTATIMANLGWKQTNKTTNSGHTIDNSNSSELTVPSLLDLDNKDAFEKEDKEDPQHAAAELTTSTATMSIVELYSNKSIFENGANETKESIARPSTESNPDNPNTSSQMQKSPSFNLNLRKEARPGESDKIPLLHQNKSANESFSKQNSMNLINSMPHSQYEQCMLHSEEMPVEEKIVTMERSYSGKSKAPFIGLLKEEEEAHLLGMARTQDNHAGTKNTVSSTSPKKDKRKPRSSFFSSCMCCATVP
ncbi:dentin sialophosphoprotein isoform X1 [Vigna radiata var. radiata]|uniref:Dentin sialophosphoprotein isoform X1 n=1 Tax=Vigna radiata var. radiata TaxID=3916 RepID=A0A3Q0FE55_VIGRR|nr:dentin sialophosphoprotein isoform X1 [Vigna radiata var. radiata]XP_022640910.1 dentin sialophosphoprotein isoform X1 [Vigna radiata var. radiata]